MYKIELTWKLLTLNNLFMLSEKSKLERKSKKLFKSRGFQPTGRHLPLVRIQSTNAAIMTKENNAGTTILNETVILVTTRRQLHQPSGVKLKWAGSHFFAARSHSSVPCSFTNKITPNFTFTGFPRYSRGLRSIQILIREYQNPYFKPKTS